MPSASTQLATLFHKLSGVLKAVPESEVADALDTLSTQDMWNGDNVHTNPTLHTGPAQEARGSGAEKMVRDYSDLRPQDGPTQQAAELARQLDAFQRSMAGRIDRIEKAVVAIMGFGKAVQQPASLAALDDGFISTARSKLDRANSYIRRAETLTGTQNRQNALEKATALLKSAERALIKAEGDDDNDEPLTDENLLADTRAILARLLRRLEAVVEDIAEEVAPAEEEQAKARVASSDVGKSLARIEEALNGHRVLETNIAGLMDIVAGKSRNPDAPVITKSAPVTAADYHERFERAVDAGLLNEFEQAKTETLISRDGVVRAGRADRASWQAEVDKAPAAVRAIFEPARAA